MKDQYNPVTVLADNLSRLMEHEREKGRTYYTAQAVGAKAEVGHGTVHRAKKGECVLNIANLQAIASVFGLQAWQLLVPKIDVDNPPVLQFASKEEQELYQSFKALAVQLHNPKR